LSRNWLYVDSAESARRKEKWKKKKKINKFLWQAVIVKNQIEHKTCKISFNFYFSFVMAIKIWFLFQCWPEMSGKWDERMRGGLLIFMMIIDSKKNLFYVYHINFHEINQHICLRLHSDDSKYRVLLRHKKIFRFIDQRVSWDDLFYVFNNLVILN